MSHAPSITSVMRFSVALRRPHIAGSLSGDLTLGETVLTFRTHAGPMPWAGRSTHRKLRAGLTQVRWDPEIQGVVLAFGPDEWTFVGSDAQALARSLGAEQVAESPPLVEGHGRLIVGDGSPLDGDVILNVERLRFRATNADQDTLDVEWGAISDVRLSGYRRVLTATVAGQSIRLEGPTAPRVSAWLTALAEGARVGLEPQESEKGLERWPASRRIGALGIQGELVVGTQHAQFVPSGLVERTIGLRELTLPFSDLHRIVVHGWTEKKLTFVTSAGKETFTFDNTEQRFHHLVDYFHAGHRAWAADAARAQEAIESVLAAWAPVLDRRPVHVMEVHLALQVRGKHDATVGVLVQTADEVRFLPVGGPMGTAKAELHPVPRILRNYGTDGGGDAAVCFSVAGEHLRYLPAEGAEFVRRFWDRCRAPSRIFHLDAPSRRALMRVLGPSRFIRARATGAAVVNVSQIQDDGLTWVALLGPEGTLPTIGQRVSVDVGQPEGVYRFETEVVDVHPEERVLSFLRPKTVRVYNQRRTYRVAVDLSARVRLGHNLAAQGPMVVDDSLFGRDLPAPTDQPLKLSDLSLGGCAAHGATDLPLGASVELEVDLDDATPLRVTGRVLRSDRVEGEALRRFGIRFENIRRSEEVRLQRHVLRAQRAELAEFDQAMM